MENKNGQGIFYGVIGVATLVVAIIGATFAFFAASANNNTTITGQTGSAGLTLEVTELSTDATGRLVPQLTSTLGSAITGTNSKSCVDGNGNTVCHVYQIVVTNTGSAAAALTGTLTLDKGGATNMQWGKMATATTLGNGFAAASSAALDNPTLAPTGETGASQTYYVVVWLSEINEDQSDPDAGKTFRGTVEFVSASGTGITSTFTA